MKTEFITNEDGLALAYQKYDGTGLTTGPTIVFLAGHGSDMFGSKAEALAQKCQAEQRRFLRFDYSGHGLSEGQFLDGTISSWTKDALLMIDQLTTGPVILVGSSLGGWIMMNVAIARAARIAGCIGIAAAPDFTETLIWQSLTKEQQDEMAQTGQIALPNPYADEDVIYPYRLITDGRDNLLTHKQVAINCPMILHQGMADHEVPWQTACDIAGAVQSDDVTINLLKSSGHRFSQDHEIKMILASVDEMISKLQEA